MFGREPFATGPMRPDNASQGPMTSALWFAKLSYMSPLRRGTSLVEALFDRHSFGLKRKHPYLPTDCCRKEIHVQG